MSLPDDSVTTVAVLKSERTDVVFEVKKQTITRNPRQHSCSVVAFAPLLCFLVTCFLLSGFSVFSCEGKKDVWLFIMSSYRNFSFSPMLT